MNRRTFLVTAGLATGAALAGCTGFPGAGTPERPWPESEPIDDPNGTHDLFVENHTDRTELAWVRLVRDDDAVLVDGRYELPDGRAIRFDDLAAWERTFTIDVAIDGVGRRSFEWSTADCGPDSATTGGDGSRNAAVRVEDGDQSEGVRITRWVDECDAINTGTIPTGSADSFRLNG